MRIKKSLVLLFILVFGLSLFTACGGSKDKLDDEKEEPDSTTIFTRSSELFVVFPEGSDLEPFANELAGNLDNVRDTFTAFVTDSAEAKAHEIVLGQTNRPISATAKDMLERIETKGEYEERYIIYSDGASVAVLFDGEVASITVMELLTDLFSEGKFSHAQGTVKSGISDPIEYYEAIDGATHEAEWSAVESAFEGLANKDEIIKSLKSLYSIYDRKMIEWVANLYEPSICVCTQLNREESCKGTKYCGTSGFYYSNSGRDTVGYLPDVESTVQALTILGSTGLGGYSALTQKMKDGIGNFVISLQEPNGFFYHPQWGIEFTDALLSRRGRDLNWATNILNSLKLKPKYDTQSGLEGTEGVSAEAAFPLGGSEVTMVSRVIAANDVNVPAHFKTKEAFVEYLGSKNLLSSSYGIGNTISAQMTQILARDKTLAEEGADYRLVDILIEWLDENMIEEVGHWNGVIDETTGEIVPVTNYFAVNGIMKISSIYTAAKREFPHADKAAMAAADAITSDEQVKNIVDIYNNWYALKYLFDNINNYSENKEAVNEIRAMLLERGPQVIDSTRNKLLVFIKEDGSFSYTEKYSSSGSQGCPVALPNSVEGDMNATNLANSTKGYMASVLGFTSPHPLGMTEQFIFRHIVSSLKSPIKTDPSNVEIDPSEMTTFDEFFPGQTLDDAYNIRASEGGAGGKIEIVSDPREGREGNALKMTSFRGAGEQVDILKSNNSPYANSYVFEGEFCFEKVSGTDYAVQLIMNSMFMLSFRAEAGKIAICEDSSKTAGKSLHRNFGLTVEKGQWFKLKIVLYEGTADTFRAVIWFDGDLTDTQGERIVSVTDNYFDSSGKKLNGTGTPSKNFAFTSFYIMKGANAEIYLDNLDSYVQKATYQKIEDPTLLYNVDASAGEPGAE